MATLTSANRSTLSFLIFMAMVERLYQSTTKAGSCIEWNRLVNAATRSRAATPETLLDLIRSLAPFLARCLPCRTGDRDELPDAPRFVAE